MAKPPPKVRSPKKKEGQLERFKEKAKELGADETGELFSNAFNKIVHVRKS